MSNWEREVYGILATQDKQDDLDVIAKGSEELLKKGYFQQQTNLQDALRMSRPEQNGVSNIQDIFHLYSQYPLSLQKQYVEKTTNTTRTIERGLWLRNLESDAITASYSNEQESLITPSPHTTSQESQKTSHIVKWGPNNNPYLAAKRFTTELEDDTVYTTYFLKEPSGNLRYLALQLDAREARCILAKNIASTPEMYINSGIQVPFNQDLEHEDSFYRVIPQGKVLTFQVSSQTVDGPRVQYSITIPYMTRPTLKQLEHISNLENPDNMKAHASIRAAEALMGFSLSVPGEGIDLSTYGKVRPAPETPITQPNFKRPVKKSFLKNPFKFR